jgi:signal transduction histidine kinase
LSTRSGAALIGLALALAAGAASLNAASDHDDGPASAAMTIAVGLAFVVAGVVAARRRPDNRTGAVMVVAGLTWFTRIAGEANASVPYTLGVAFGGLAYIPFTYLALSFPSGRLSDPLDRLVVGAVAVVVAVLQPIARVFEARPNDCDQCPANAFLMTDHATVADALLRAGDALSLVAAATVVAVLVRRWRAATPPLRRVLAPVYSTGVATAVVLGTAVALETTRGSSGPVFHWLVLALLVAVPVSFLLGLVRGRLAQTAVGRLVVELGDGRGRDDLREAIRRALGDPSLTIAYFDRELRRYVDERERPLPPPAGDGGRVATIVERRGEPVAALVHDASLLDGRGLLDAVTAAAGLALEHGRNLEELRRSEARQRALLNAMPDLLFRMGMDGTYHGVKAERSGLLAVPEDELLGASMHDVLPREVAHAILTAAQEAQRDGGVHTVEYQLELDGEPRDFEGRVVVAGPDEFLLIVRDFTDRKRQEEELRRSRARIVEAGDSARRRLERNLHDGAQQRLVSTLLSLRVARTRLASDPAAAERMLDQAVEELAYGLEELRELARGIHPAILTDRGLEAALRALAARSPVPVAMDGFAERLPPAVEAAAYYVVSEALANVAKYAGAATASVSVARQNGRAVIEVADDGVGGASPERGTGLRGLADRVEALNGRLLIESAPGVGTRVRAEIPVVDA